MIAKPKKKTRKTNEGQGYSRTKAQRAKEDDHDSGPYARSSIDAPAIEYKPSGDKI